MTNKKSKIKKAINKKSLIIKSNESLADLSFFSFDTSSEYYKLMMAVPEMGMMLKSKRLDGDFDLEKCVSIGLFYIHLSKMYGEEQNKSIFYWIVRSLHPVLVGFGVTSKTPSVVFSDNYQRYRYFKFLCCIGCGFLFDNPYRDNMDVKIDTDTAEMLKIFDCKDLKK